MTIQTITVPRRLDAVSAPQLRATIITAVEAGVPRLVLDCSATEFIDSSGLAALVSGHKAMRLKKGIFALTGIQGGARDIFDLTRMDLVFTMYPTLTDAMTALGVVE
jgi:anti-sigma B factor antagonist